MFECEGFVECETLPKPDRRSKQDEAYFMKAHRAISKFAAAESVRCVKCHEDDFEELNRHYSYLKQAVTQYRDKADIVVVRRGHDIYLVKRGKRS